MNWGEDNVTVDSSSFLVQSLAPNTLYDFSVTLNSIMCPMLQGNASATTDGESVM